LRARLHQALFSVTVAAGLSLLLLCPARAAPLEEDIPQSPPMPHHAKVQPDASSADQPTDSSARSTPASASSDDSASKATRSEAALGTASTATPPVAHKYFPYTIRSGDTLETIADIFGVQVSDITRANRRIADGDLMAGDTIRIPNPFVTREAELNTEVERLSIEKEEAERRADQASNALSSVHSQLETAAASNAHYERDLHALPWWRAATWAAAIAGVVMFGMMLAALIEWWNLRSRYRAVAEMNESLRRLDYRYRMVMAKAELRLQELYGRRRRGIEDGQERPRIPEEAELEKLDLQIKEILESYLQRLGPPNGRARRARWRESIGAVGAPIEARTARRW
jgi:LysM repeat protein